MVNKFENLFLPLVFFTVQFSKSCPTPFGRFRSLKSACLVYQPLPFPSSVFCAFFLIFFLTFPLGSNIPPLGSALPTADFANYTHLSPFVNDFLPFYCAFLFFLPHSAFCCDASQRDVFPRATLSNALQLICNNSPYARNSDADFSAFCSAIIKANIYLRQALGCVACLCIGINRLFHRQRHCIKVFL